MMELKPTSLPPICTVTRSVERPSAFSWGPLVPWAFHMFSVVAPLQLTSVKAPVFRAAETSEG